MKTTKNEELNQLKEITGASLGCGWLHDEPAILLEALIIYYKPEVVIQTGHLWGKSALVILQSLSNMYCLESEGQNAHEMFEKFVNTNTPTRPNEVPVLHSIDPYCLHVPNANEGIDYLTKRYKNFNFFGITSSKYFETAKFSHEKRIMGFVDGDHSYLGAYEDMVNLARLGAQVIVLDDTSWIPYLKRASKRIAKRYGYTLSEFSRYNGIVVLSKNKMVNSPFKNKWTSLMYEVVCSLFGLSFALFIRKLIVKIKTK